MQLLYPVTGSLALPLLLWNTALSKILAGKTFLLLAQQVCQPPKGKSVDKSFFFFFLLPLRICARLDALVRCSFITIGGATVLFAVLCSAA